MSISSDSTRKAGPFTGTGAIVPLPFSFKVFTTADVLVIRTDLTGIESTLTLGSDYTVTLNSNQDSNPGGVVTPIVAPGVGYLTTLSSQVAAIQSIILTNTGGFFPTVLNDAMDRLTILVQQLKEQMSRAVTTSISSGISPTVMAGYIVALYNNLANIITVSGNTTNINTVAGNNANVSTVATNNANVTAVGANIASVTGVNSNASNINAVNANSTNINTVATNNTNVTNVGGSISSVNTVASNISSINTNTTNIAAIQGASANAASASTSASAAATSASSASNSATSASSSATTATTQAGISTTQAGISTTQATIATAQANNATVSANAAAGSASSASSYGALAAAAQVAAAASAVSAVNAPGTSGTSTTSLTIGLTTQSFNTQTAKNWVVGQFVTLASTASPANWMYGYINTYNSTTGAMSVVVLSISGSGTFASWSIGLSAPVAQFSSGNVISHANLIAQSFSIPDGINATWVDPTTVGPNVTVTGLGNSTLRGI